MNHFSPAKRAAAAMLAAALCASMLTLSGCMTKNYSRRDIEKYITDTYGIRNFTVSDGRLEVTSGKDSYTDYLWTVTEDDGTEFYVLDDYHWGTEWLVNSLRDNRNTVHLRRILAEDECPGFEIRESDPVDGYIDFITLVGSFENRAVLRERYEALRSFASRLPAGLSASYRLEFDHPYRFIGEYDDSTGDSSGVVSAGKDFDFITAEKNLLHCALDLRYEDVIAEYNEREIHDLLKENFVFRIGVIKSDGRVDYYDDLIESRFYYGISFPSMYEVIARNGYPVEGDKDDFSFTALDGSVYEFSLDFRENESYYYIKDGEHVPMGNYFYNHLHIGKIYELTGINATDGYAEARKEKEKERQDELSKTDA